MSDLTTSELYIKQLEYENEMVDLGRESYLSTIADAEASGRGADTSFARSLVAQITGQIVDAVKTNLDNTKSMYVEPLKALKYERAVIIALRNLFGHVSSSSSGKPVTRSSASVAIAEAIQLELKMESLCTESPKYMSEVQSSWKTKRASSIRHKGNVVNHILTENNMEWKHWDKVTKVGVGGLLLHCICDNSDIFCMKTLYQNRRPVTYVEFTTTAEEWITTHKDFRSLLRPLYRPMIVPPVDWSPSTKPYLSLPVNSTLKFVRVKSKESKKFYKTVHPDMYKAVSLAQATPWRVSTKIADFISELLKLKYPKLIPNGEIAERPLCELPKDLLPADMDDAQSLIFKDWKSEVRTMYTNEVSRKSNRNRLIMMLDITDEYRGFKEIYFPHSVDSRGRIYSIPTVLQPQGDDICKGILEFANGEKLTDAGLYELKLQIASKYGHDKESHEYRIKWFDDNTTVLLSVADAPLDHLDWLEEADKPFQMLSAMFAYLQWTKNPEALIHARVNKDGACNGLQHFSAMLRDGDVGKSVNLLPSSPSDVPLSVYKVVAEEVQTDLKERAHNGEMFAQTWLLFWEKYTDAGTVDYKCMKRPVMTLPYSATMFSRMQYIKDYIREKGAHKFFGESFGHAIKYFADLVTAAMDRRIASARLILDWLVTACRDIMTVQDNVQWTTPLGFTVFNRKNKQIGKQIGIRYEGKRIRFRVREMTDKPDIAGMASAIAPNFVHSMDACHMLRLVNRAVGCNITSLHLVHDDYGCHANHGGLLAELAKEEFADMYTHSNPLREFYESYSDIITEEPPEFINTLNLEDINKSTYAFD